MAEATHRDPKLSPAPSGGIPHWRARSNRTGGVKTRHVDITNLPSISAEEERAREVPLTERTTDAVSLSPLVASVQGRPLRDPPSIKKPETKEDR